MAVLLNQSTFTASSSCGLVQLLTRRSEERLTMAGMFGRVINWLANEVCRRSLAPHVFRAPLHSTTAPLRSSLLSASCSAAPAFPAAAPAQHPAALAGGDEGAREQQDLPALRAQDGAELAEGREGGRGEDLAGQELVGALPCLFALAAPHSLGECLPRRRGCRRPRPR